MIRVVIVAAALAAAVPAGAQRADTTHSGQAVAVFAGGCFWCVEADFDKLAGVVSTTSGYVGGRVPNPTYEQVSSQGTGHYEAVRIVYDPKQVGYAQLLDHFWKNIDPTDADGQFCDKGESYRSAIFALSPQQRVQAESSKAKLAASGRLKVPIATKILAAAPFYPAEGYHQNYYKKNPIKYRFYRFNCGRDARLKEVWGD